MTHKVASPRSIVSRRVCQWALVLCLAGCASTPLQLPSESDVETARRNGTLETLFTDLKLRSAIDPNAAKLSKQIGEMIGEDQYNDVISRLDKNSIKGITPVSVLNQLSPRVESISKFNTEYAEKLKAYLSDKNKETQDYIKRANNMIGDMDANIGDQLDYARVLSALNGQDSSSLVSQLLSNAYNVANNLEVEGNYKAAFAKWQALAEAAPDYQDTIERMNRSSGSFNVDRFNAFMEAGDVESATALYTNLASTGIDVSDLRDGAQQLIAYFALQAEAALDDEVLSDAFAAAKQIRLLEQAGASNYQNPIATAVLEALILRAELYVSQDRLGMALGSALAATELAPNDTITSELADKLIEQLYDKSITRLSLGAFTGTDEYAQLGNRLSSLIKERLVASQLNTIRLIERDKLQSVFVEKELIAMKGGEVNTTVEPADIVVQGEILAARIDQTREDRRKKKRVVVEIEQTPNPAYAEWDKLSDSKKEKTEEPDEFLEKDIKEDVSITSTVVKKDGFLSAAYRLINPVTANIMSYQSLEETNQYTGETTEGLEIGLFILEGEVADVPSDGQVLAELASSVSTKVADQLVERFSDPVSVFSAEADTYLAKDQVVNASFELGKAYSYQRKSDVDASELERILKNIALDSNAYIEE